MRKDASTKYLWNLEKILEVFIQEVTLRLNRRQILINTLINMMHLCKYRWTEYRIRNCDLERDIQ